MWKVSKCGVFSGPCFPVFGLNTEIYGDLISPNVEKYRPEKTPYLDNFHAMNVTGSAFQLAEISFNLVKSFVLLKRDFQLSIYFK